MKQSNKDKQTSSHLILPRRGFLGASAGAALGLSIPHIWVPRPVKAATTSFGTVKHLIYIRLNGGFRFPCAFNGDVASQFNPFGTASGVPGGVQWGVSKLLESASYLSEAGTEGMQSVSNQANKIKLNFNHPVKELIWVVQHDDVIGVSEVNDNEGVLANNQWSNYTDVLGSLTFDHSFPLLSGNPVEMAKLQLNGHDRFSTRLGDYFNLVQPYQHHTNIPLSPGINVYSFALRPEEHQPSGSANFSRIDNATLQLSVRYNNTLLEDCTVDVNGVPASTLEDIEPVLGCSLSGVEGKVRIYAVNYNVLRIMSGMGGLAYSN